MSGHASQCPCAVDGCADRCCPRCECSAAKLEPLDKTCCRSGCRTQDHATYGECLKAARSGVAAGETARGQY